MYRKFTKNYNRSTREHLLSTSCKTCIAFSEISQMEVGTKIGECEDLFRPV